MDESAGGRHGEIVTFYSFKGGIGRTMALANVAWILAASGKRVLAADWDLESPGLLGFFYPFVDVARLSAAGGVIDMIREFDHDTLNDEPHEPDWYARYAQTGRYAYPLNWPFGGAGSLHLLPAGRQNRDYVTQLSDLHWEEFYDRRHGGRFFDAMREDMKRHYDYVLVDSRSGLNEVADICMTHLPDTIVNCFTLTDQAINGAAALARMISTRYRNRAIRILPVPMHVDTTQLAQAEAGRKVAMRRLAGFPSNMTDGQRQRYWSAVEVPYQPAYAFEEVLAAIADPPGLPGTLLAAYQELVVHLSRGAVTAAPVMDEGLRRRTAARFVRTPDPAITEVTLQYAERDAVWAEWVRLVCRGVGLAVADPGSGRQAQAATRGPRLILVSENNAHTLARVTRDERAMPGNPPLAVYIADVAPLAVFDEAHSVRLAGADVVAATTGLLNLLGHTRTVLDGPNPNMRFPGTPPTVFQAPQRDPQFTGREADLRALRARLNDRDEAEIVPAGSGVVLQGMGGIGKTQIAVEYAYRYAHAYDLVWWIDATADVTTQLAMLAPHLGVTAAPGLAGTAHAALAALDGGRVHRRWLVIIDGAEDLDAVANLLPRGSGHAIVTSRNPAWAEHADALEVGLFERAESLAHLRRRIPTIRDSEAAQVAASVADLPLAVAAAGTWLADSGRAPAELLAEQGGLGPGLQVTWDGSLRKLREETPPAYRLLEVCAVLSPEIPLRIVYSDALAEPLAEPVPSGTGQWMRGKLVQAASRLALVQLDVRSEEAGGSRVLMHPVLQQVIRSRMTEQELEATRHHAHVALAAARPRSEVDDPRSWPEYSALWPHLDASGAAECGDHSVRQLFIKRLRYLWLKGDVAEGRTLGRYLDKRWVQALDVTADPAARTELRRQILHLRFHIGNLRRDESDYATALADDLAVHDRQAATQGAHHPYTLMTAGSIGADLRALGDYHAALIRDRDTHDAWLDQFGNDHPRTLTAANNLAGTYRLLGDFRTAMRLDEHVHTRRRLVEGELHPYTLASGANLGRDLRDAGRYEPSISLLRTVTAALAQQLGMTSRHTLAERANLAVSLRVAGHPAEAAELLHEAYSGLRDTAGPDSPDTPIARLSYGLALRVLLRHDEAHREVTATHAGYLSRLGPNHPCTLAAAVDLAVIDLDQGDTKIALRRTRDAARGLATALGPDHPHTLAARSNIAVGLAGLGDLMSAVIVARDVLDRSQEVLGADHPDTLRAAANAEILSQEGEGDETETAERLARALGRTHPAVVAVQDRRLLARVIDLHPF
jgi:MinD-like ATPase involved in chromosome partitioning or flagellar assembly